MRMFEPENRGSGDLSGIVYYHGGGWVLGSIGSVSHRIVFIIIIIIIIQNLYSAIMPLGGYRGAGETGR